LQNNLKELWSLLHFLLPQVFTNWEAFESWFDFSDLQDEEGTAEFIADRRKQDLVKKIHLILQPLLLRRIKADVEHMLPRKREYVLYAPMTAQQTELYNILSDKGADARKYLENKVVERLNRSGNTPATSRKASRNSSKARATEESDSEGDVPLARLALRGRKRKADAAGEPESKPSQMNAFEKLMGKRNTPDKKAAKTSQKRKSNDSSTTPSKSAKSSRNSSPATSVRSSARSRKTRTTYQEADASDEDKLSDDEFERRLADELVEIDVPAEISQDEEEVERAKTLELASK
jgi:ATP-dependent DNA helicase